MTMTGLAFVEIQEFVEALRQLVHLVEVALPRGPAGPSSSVA